MLTFSPGRFDARAAEDVAPPEPSTAAATFDGRTGTAAFARRTLAAATSTGLWDNFLIHIVDFHLWLQLRFDHFLIDIDDGYLFISWRSSLFHPCFLTYS